MASSLAMSTPDGPDGPVGELQRLQLLATARPVSSFLVVAQSVGLKLVHDPGHLGDQLVDGAGGVRWPAAGRPVVGRPSCSRPHRCGRARRHRSRRRPSRRRASWHNRNGSRNALVSGLCRFPLDYTCATGYLASDEVSASQRTEGVRAAVWAWGTPPARARPST